MLKPSRLKTLYESPLPPMALTEYETMSKFLNSGARRCKASGRNFDLFLDWAIHVLVTSLASDSASRIFLPKTRTGPFALDDLIPLSELPPSGKKQVRLSETRLIAPVWNNSDLEQALEAFYDSGFKDVKIDQPFGGAYLQELNLAIIDSPSDVDVPYVLRVWGKGSIQLDAYSLRDLEPVLRTDGETWYVREEDGSETALPVLEPRMAALYNCGLHRFCGKTAHE
nr:hypothetical protein [uncultured Oscillibacter sp.]